MSNVRPVRGTHDLIGDEAELHLFVAETERNLTRLYGYSDIQTPIFEFTEVFARTLGDMSDIVTKEMYSFEDRGGERLTLRPENTAGVVRALISNGLSQSLPLRYFYHGPMFRYERPQKGRLRQFHQTGVELIGASEPRADIEVIALGQQIVETFGIQHKVELRLNSLGDSESRNAYRRLLTDYLMDFRNRLSPDSQRRLERNPLRILDSKDEDDQKIVADAPSIEAAMNAQSRAFFDAVCEGLQRLDIAYSINPKLVRGLDYYTHTIFEFTTSELGSQGAVIAGGRYDGLVSLMGGQDIPGIGWASGVERIAMLIDAPVKRAHPIALIPIGAAAEARADIIARDLRYAGHRVDIAFKGKARQRMKRADKVGAKLAISFGDDELATATVKIRNLADGSETMVAIARLLAWLESQKAV